MNAIANQADYTRFLSAEEKTAQADAIRMAQSALLSELPGAAFALLTLAYIVTSLVGLF